jgi:hypothetical protein
LLTGKSNNKKHETKIRWKTNMIVNLYVAVDLAIAFFALVVGSYAALKAYRVSAAEKTAVADQRYELEKDY